MKKSHFLENGMYFDVTTQTKYIPKKRCELCKASYPLSVHHYLNQQKCIRDTQSKRIKHPKMWTQEFIDENQKLFTLCYQCHADVENMSNYKFFQRYGRNKNDFIYLED